MGGKTQAMRAAQVEAAAPTAERWFVVQCINKQERKARQELIHQGFDVYLPMRICPHPKARNPVTPFLPGYLFVRFDPSITRWLCILSTLGVSGMIRKAGGYPQAVPDFWIADLQRKEIDGALHLVTAPKKAEKAAKAKKGKADPVFKPGDVVRVKAGAAAGMEGLVHVAHDSDRVVVFLGMVGNADAHLRKVNLKAAEIEAVA